MYHCGFEVARIDFQQRKIVMGGSGAVCGDRPIEAGFDICFALRFGNLATAYARANLFSIDKVWFGLDSKLRR